MRIVSRADSDLPDPVSSPTTRNLPTVDRRAETGIGLLELVSRLSVRFSNMRPEQTDTEIRCALESILEFLDLDRCALFKVDAAQARLESLFVVDRGQADGPPASIDARTTLPWLFDQLSCRHEAIWFSTIDDLPPAAATDRETLRRWRMQSGLLIPIVNTGVLEHVVSFGTSGASREWWNEEVRRVRLLCDGIMGALARKAWEAARDEADRFEQLVRRLSLGFAGVPWDRIDEQINLALHELRVFCDADRCSFFVILDDTGQTRLTHLATRGPSIRLGATLQYADAFPYLHRRVIVEQQIVQFSSRDALPSEADTDKRFLAERGTQAGVYIPCLVDGVTRYVLAVATERIGTVWAPRLVDRLVVMCAVFATALGRRAVGEARLRAQTQLASARKFAQAALDALHEYLGILDAKGTLVEASVQWSADAGEVRGGAELVPVGGNYLQALESTTGDGRDAALQLVRGVRRVLLEDAQEVELETTRQVNGKMCWFRSRVLRFEVDGAVHAVVSHEDITRRRLEELELEELRARHWHAERVTQTGVLIGSLAHELSQPLTAILSNAQAGLRFLSAAEPDLHEIRDILRDVIADDKRAAGVIESLRLMLRRRRTERSAVDVVDVVQDAIRLLHSECIRLQVEVEHRLAPGSVVHADGAQLQQVVLNLLLNGLDAMAEVPTEARRLRVTVDHDADEVRVEVSDTGAGISPEDLARVFDAFWTTKSQGTGMGLAICHAIIESHGGRIWGECNPNGGSTFWFVLPRVAAPGAGARVADGPGLREGLSA